MQVNPIAPRTIYTRLADKIEKSKKLQNLILKADSNPSLFNSIFVASTAIILKPAVILGFPSKKEDSKNDNKYAISKSIGTGLIDLAMAYALFKPLSKGLDIVAKKLFDNKDSVYFQNKARCSAYKSLFNRSAKILLLPLFAWSKFALVQPLVDSYHKKGGK